jgi:hypothetical protein
MSKVKNKVIPSVPPEAVITDLVDAPEPGPVPQEKMQEVDRMALELAKAKREVALADAKTAIANNEKADLSYRYVVLQLYMKYGLNANDAITEGGDIVRGGALPQQG